MLATSMDGVNTEKTNSSATRDRRALCEAAE